MNGKIFYVIKIIFIHIIGYVLCVLQAYISMYEYKENLSSVCPRCSYIEDILTSSLFFYLFFLLAYFLFFFFVRFLLNAKKIKKNYNIISFTVIYIITCFTVNHEIFISRVTSWSTFTTMEELIGTVQESYIAILITTIIFYYSNKFLLNYEK